MYNIYKQLLKPLVEGFILLMHLSPQNREVTRKPPLILLNIKLLISVPKLTLLSWSQMPVWAQLARSNCQPSGPSWPCGSPACTCACTPCGKPGLSHRWASFVPCGTATNWKLFKVRKCLLTHENHLQVTCHTLELPSGNTDQYHTAQNNPQWCSREAGRLLHSKQCYHSWLFISTIVMKNNGYKLKDGQFGLDIRKKCWIAKTVRHWNGLPGTAVDRPTLIVFKARLDWIFEQSGLVEGIPVHGTGAGTRWS